MTLFALFFFFLGAFCLTAVSTAMQWARRRRSKESLLHIGHFLFIRPLIKVFFAHRSFEIVSFSLLFSKSIYLFCFAGLLCPPQFSLDFVFFAFLGVLFSHFIPRTLAQRHPEDVLRFFAPLASLFVLIIFPLFIIFLYLSDRLGYQRAKTNPLELKEKIIEIIREIDDKSELHVQERTLIESVVCLKDRIVREIQVPRVDVFALPSHVSLEEARQTIVKEGYSRIPVYDESLDTISGILLAKNLLGATGKTLKDCCLVPLYIPETKPVLMALQEFRQKHQHLGIVVDEYGCMSGIVTIEDIIEELVGEIGDEHDKDEAALFIDHKDGTFTVDARMSILDCEENLSIHIPQDGDYDSLGGFIFHRAGKIPRPGFAIHSEDFELEVLSSNDRCVEKVRVKKLV